MAKIRSSNDHFIIAFCSVRVWKELKIWSFAGDSFEFCSIQFFTDLVCTFVEGLQVPEIYHKLGSSFEDFTISLEDILLKASDEINGHYYNEKDDNTYIKQGLKPFHIIVQNINNDECTYYNAPIRPCGGETVKKPQKPELIISNSCKSSLT